MDCMMGKVEQLNKLPSSSAGSGGTLAGHGLKQQHSPVPGHQFKEPATQIRLQGTHGQAVFPVCWQPATYVTARVAILEGKREEWQEHKGVLYWKQS
eukprot:scaffold32367_cov22-Tisochrysis_lutea.AAC.2